MAHSLPPLPYDFAALEPHIDAQTMQIHHGKHHQAYINNLNNALSKHPELADKDLEDLLRNLSSAPDNIPPGVANMAGGQAAQVAQKVCEILVRARGVCSARC